ncbi:hypothetical protein JCM11251_006670 [Rhodosporidiobolus azoricus]
MKGSVSSTSSSPPWSSSLGAMHHAPPSVQGETVRALFSFFRRNTPSATSTCSSPSSPTTKTLKKPFPSSSSLDCTIQPMGEKSTYSPLSPTSFPSLAPPPYSPSANSGVEEDLVVLDVGAKEMKMVVTLETKAERKERLKQEKLEKVRRELIETDKRMDEALGEMGL